ncbi:formylglycine-generating enzyme family protein [Anabaena sp. FACHB-1237]|uniref:formylglycine-generating enzyme family protein n=1 Tax=Anabaena sp. FACHB-1237 TaxID=2692769 RepID=UPI0028C3C440|nr:formylglycine-generating enzyme family protein [Anabaena sp. FACHB-1237]
MNAQFDQFITTLEKELNLTGTEIAEVLWLAQQTCTPISVEKKPNSSLETNKDNPNNQSENTPPQIPNKPQKPEQMRGNSEQEPPPPVPVAVITKSPNDYPDSGLSINIPDVSSLPYPRKIAKALHPLIQYIAYGKPVLLNEKATVELMAELNGICIPILQQRTELKFDLVFVIDKSDSMIFWQRIIKELQQILKHYGIFRHIQTLGISQDKGNIYLKQEIGKKIGKKIYSPQKLIDPSGHRIIFIVSDCVSEIWRNGTAFNLFNIWGKYNTVAIVQMLPERMWLRTALSSGAMVQLNIANSLANSANNTVANRNLSIKKILIWDDINFHKSIKVPVFSLTPDSIETWGKMIIGKGTTGAGGFAFPDSDIIKQQTQTEENELENELENISPITNQQRVYQFRMSSSPLARNLASLLASAPVINLPIVRLIQKNFLPQSEKLVHIIAEVFLGGILKPTQEITPGKHPDDIEYRFVNEEVRDIFLKDSLRITSLEIVDKISEYIAKKLGESVKEFQALLKNPQELKHIQQEKNLSGLNFEYFATITTKVLKRLGGQYRTLANELEKAWKVTPITLEEFSFTTATILTTKTFDFEVATIEPEKPLFGMGKTQLNIKRQPQKAEYFPEELGDNLTLAMVSIPGGTFMMGSPKEQDSYDSERPQHSVTVPPFLMGKYPITQAQWRFVAQLPQINRQLELDPSAFKGDNRPVEQVSWYDAVEFCLRLSQYTDRPYSLPSEAQWEYACRAGTTTPFHFGETITTDLANYDGNYTYGNGVKGVYREKTTEVGSFKVANNFGLYDMHGNVWEWCLDDWHNNYEGSPTDGRPWFDDNTTLFDKTKTAVVRGGSWNDIPVICRSASRNPDVRAGRGHFDNYIGFRVVCGVGRTL